MFLPNIKTLINVIEIIFTTNYPNNKIKFELRDKRTSINKNIKQYPK